MTCTSWLLFLCSLASAPLLLAARNLPNSRNVSMERCAPLNSSFHAHCDCTESLGLDCGGTVDVEFTCRGLPQFFEEGFADSEVHCLRIVDSPLLTTITTAGLRQFPKLIGLVVDNTGLSKISNGALPQLSSTLTYLEVILSRLTIVPHITNMNKLHTVLLSQNLIISVDTNTFRGVYQLSALDLSQNMLSSLNGPIFTRLCQLRKLLLSDNPITEIEDEVFTDTLIDELRLANTRISRVPSHPHLNGEVEVLDLSGCTNLKVFNFVDENGNKIYPYLRKVSFAYHAHCCQLDRLAEREGNPQKRNDGSRRRRDVDASNAMPMPTLVQLQSSVPNLNPTPSPSLVPNLESASSSMSSTSVLNPQSMSSSTSTSMYIPSTLSPSPIPDPQLVSTSIPAAVASPVPNPSEVVAPLTTTVLVEVTNCPFLMRPSMCDPEATAPADTRGCFKLNTTAECVQMITSSMPTVTPTSTTIALTSATTSILPAATPTSSPVAPTSFTALPNSTSSNSTDPPTTPPTEPPTTPPIDPTTNPPNDPIDCDAYCGLFGVMGDFASFSQCNACNGNGCDGSSCPTMFQQFCSECHNVHNCRRRRRRSVRPQIFRNQEKENIRSKRQSVEPDFTSPYVVKLPNYNEQFCCTPIPDPNQTTDTQLDFCTIALRKFEHNMSASRFDEVMCSPESDPFNPCLDLLGESDGLRAAIWIVCLFALMGNFLVFVVFFGYSVIIRKAEQDMFSVHFMYFNLALADFLMGVYLFIIAVVDADSRGQFYLKDIAWRTGPGCGFAGFCAILSTVVSVYVLVAITLERTYTITKVFNRKKLTKIRVFVIMGIGWLAGIVYAMLPLVGVSGYSSVAICLPFDVEKSTDLAYVVFLLLITGIAFVLIAVCYGIIFQQVFCKCGQISPIRDRKRSVNDIKIAARIFILIITNFVCWFPIALMSLTAAFNKSLVNNLEFARWAIVFIFPINACLNPFLYSITTRIFRDQFILILSKCGLFKNRAKRIKNAQVGITPSFTSKTSKTSTDFINNKIVTRLRSFSLTSQSSTLNLLERMNRRASAANVMNDSGDLHQLRIFESNNRRTSTVSNTSSEEMSNSRRGSTFSAGSNDALLGTIYTNNGLLSSGSMEVSKGSAELQNRARAKLSASSLGALPEEEVELPVEAIIEEGVVKVNPAYKEEDQDSTKESGRDSGLVDETSQEEEANESTEVIMNRNAYMDNEEPDKMDEDSESGSSGSS